MWYWYNASDLLEDIEEIIDSQKSPTSKGIEILDCMRIYKEEHGLLPKPIKGQKLYPEHTLNMQEFNQSWGSLRDFMNQKYFNDFFHMSKDKFLNKYKDVTPEMYKKYKGLIDKFL